VAEDRGETLIPQAEAIVDSWRSVIGRLASTRRNLRGPGWEPDEHYKGAIKLRFVQWVSDVCLQPHDQRWLTTRKRSVCGMCRQEESDRQSQTPSVVPQRYLLAFTAIVITTIGGISSRDDGRPKEESCSDAGCLDSAPFCLAVTLCLARMQRTTAGNSYRQGIFAKRENDAAPGSFLSVPAVTRNFAEAGLSNG